MELKETKPEYGRKQVAPPGEPGRHHGGRPVDARDLLRVDPKDRNLYESCEFSLPHLTAYSISWLAAWEIPTTYENISVLNARLFPAQFALTGFPESPDAMRTNRTLLQMRPKYRGFATSDPRRGVFLTEKGREAAAKVMDAVGAPTFEGKQVEQSAAPEIRTTVRGRERTRNPAQIIADCKSKLLYRRYAEGKFEETDIVHFLGLVSLFDHTPPSEVRKALRQLRADAQAAADDEFLVFLGRVEERFSAYLNRADPK
ncbi:MAG TPA: hypothetical protein VI454_03165 [Verrucomicrobiae bacterium]|jgi:hypothetical protein